MNALENIDRTRQGLALRGASRHNGAVEASPSVGEYCYRTIDKRTNAVAVQSRLSPTKSCHQHSHRTTRRSIKTFSNRYRQGTIITRSNRLKRDFLTFCEQTELNGLLHVPQTDSRPMKSIYILSFIIGTVAVLFLLGKILNKYMADPKGINQEFVTDSPMPFPELNLCRYMVGLSQAQIVAYNVSSQLAQVFHWSMEVNYDPSFENETKIRDLLNQTKSEFLALKIFLNTDSYSRILQLFLPSYRLIHPMKAVIYEKRKAMYSENYVIENRIMTYMEDLYMYNVICHKIQLLSDSVLALIIPFPPQNDFITNYTKNYQLLPIMSSYLLMDGNHDVIARIEPETNYWGSYKLKSSKLMNSKTHPCQEDPTYYQQHCVMECFGAAPKSSPNCRHCQSVFMHINLGNRNDTELCDPWQWLECNTTVNRGTQGLSVVKCINVWFSNCIQACNDESYDYAVSSVAGDKQLSKHVGWKADPMEISENRSIFILSASKRPNRHVRIRQYPILDLASVFADFGGYMGLFLGSSVLTLVHVLVFWGRSCFLNPMANAVRRNQSSRKKVNSLSVPSDSTNADHQYPPQPTLGATKENHHSPTTILEKNKLLKRMKNERGGYEIRRQNTNTAENDQEMNRKLLKGENDTDPLLTLNGVGQIHCESSRNGEHFFVLPVNPHEQEGKEVETIQPKPPCQNQRVARQTMKIAGHGGYQGRKTGERQREETKHSPSSEEQHRIGTQVRRTGKKRVMC